MWTQGNSSGGVYYFVTGVAADPSGNVIVVGDFQGTGNTSGTTYMIAKLSGTNGTIQWQQAPVTFSRYGYQNLIYTQVALDSQGDIFLGGLDASSGWSQCTVAELANGTGTQQWRQKFGASQSCVPGNVAVDISGNVVMARQHVSSLLFQHQPGGNERCLCGQAELDWSGSVAAAVWQRE